MAGAGPGFDERRGIHLLSPGDLVAYRDAKWDVTGVHLATQPDKSFVTLASPILNDPDLRIPLQLIEGSCAVFLRATKR